LLAGLGEFGGTQNVGRLAYQVARAVHGLDETSYPIQSRRQLVLALAGDQLQGLESAALLLILGSLVILVEAIAAERHTSRHAEQRFKGWESELQPFQAGQRCRPHANTSEMLGDRAAKLLELEAAQALRLTYRSNEEMIVGKPARQRNMLDTGMLAFLRLMPGKARHQAVGVAIDIRSQLGERAIVANEDDEGAGSLIRAAPDTQL
jgi:hypothetical protein